MVGVVGRHEQPGHAVGDDLGDAADARADWSACRNRIASRKISPNDSYRDGATRTSHCEKRIVLLLVGDLPEEVNSL